MQSQLELSIDPIVCEDDGIWCSTYNANKAKNNSYVDEFVSYNINMIITDLVMFILTFDTFL